jgi:hypothetical protein
MTLDDVEALLKSARTPAEVFGVDQKKTYHALTMATHPDRNPGDKRAEALFKQVNDLWAIRDTKPVTIKSPKKEYTVLKLLAAGDVADVHLATALLDGKPHDYILKIARVDGGYALLDNEQKTVKELLEKAGTHVYARMLPTLVESFPAKDKIQKRVNVFLAEDGYYTLDEVHSKHPTLDSRHLGWIFKRFLMALGFVHKWGKTHAAILPAHVRLQTEEHGLQLIGWGHSVETSKTVTTISAKYRDWYAPEVLKKKPVTAETDLYMAAKCMIFLAGGDPVSGRMPESVPSKMQRFFRSCLLEGQKMRPGDAWKLHDEFSEMLQGLYGPPKYHELVMA